MATSQNGWYLPGDNAQPAGPFTSEDIIGWLRGRQVAETTLCWRPGMGQWCPIETVEPFASAIRARRRQVRRRFFIGTLAAATVLAMVVGALVAYTQLVEPAAVREGQRLIAAGLYTDAAGALAPFTAKHPHHPKGTYLLFLARANEYAEQGSNLGFVEHERESCHRAIGADPELAKRAAADFADATARVPKDAPDRVLRLVTLARLRGSLGLAATTDLVQEILHIVSGVPQAGVLEHLPVFADWARTEPAVAEPLALALLTLADKAIGDGDAAQAERFLQAAERVCPARAGEVGSRRTRIEKEAAARRASIAQQMARKRIELLEDWLARGNAEAVVNSLTGQDRANAVSLQPADITRLSLAAARQLAGRNNQAASRALQQAVRLDPQLAETEEIALLRIRTVEKPGREKLSLCQEFLQRHKESGHRAEVLECILLNATEFAQHQRGRSSWSREAPLPYLKAAYGPALELLKEEAPRPNLDSRAFALAHSLAEAKEVRLALSLTDAILRAFPDSTRKLQIEQARALWGRQVHGTLPPDYYDLADRVERELKVMTLTTPAAVRPLAANPREVQVLQVADECTAKKFSSEERSLLQRWVLEGGILWANNNVLDFFGTRYKREHSYGSSYVARPGVTAKMCPILAGCQQVQVLWRGYCAHDLSHKDATPLLIATYSSRHFCTWSIVRYGRGWISDVKGVDTTTYDGARFWLNFRLFCLGRDIPGAPPSPIKTPSRPPWVAHGPGRAEVEPAIRPITNVTNLSQALSDNARGQVLWLRGLRLDALDAGAQDRLKNWVRNGNVLWVETDIMRLFDFPNVQTVTSSLRWGPAHVQTGCSHPVVKGIEGQKVRYILAEPRIVMTMRGPAQETTPLLSRVGKGGLAMVFCAVRTFGRGVAVYRPAGILDAGNEAGRRFSEQLRSYSIGVAKGLARASTTPDGSTDASSQTAPPSPPKQNIDPNVPPEYGEAYGKQVRPLLARRRYGPENHPRLVSLWIRWRYGARHSCAAGRRSSLPPPEAFYQWIVPVTTDRIAFLPWPAPHSPTAAAPRP